MMTRGIPALALAAMLCAALTGCPSSGEKAEDSKKESPAPAGGAQSAGAKKPAGSKKEGEAKKPGAKKPGDAKKPGAKPKATPKPAPKPVNWKPFIDMKWEPGTFVVWAGTSKAENGVLTASGPEQVNLFFNPPNKEGLTLDGRYALRFKLKAASAQPLEAKQRKGRVLFDFGEGFGPKSPFVEFNVDFSGNEREYTVPLRVKGEKRVVKTIPNRKTRAIRFDPVHPRVKGNVDFTISSFQILRRD